MSRCDEASERFDIQADFENIHKAVQALFGIIVPVFIDRFDNWRRMETPVNKQYCSVAG